ncbi:MAG: CRISPR-associated endonuclease Cas3'', partial [Deltaproteobacteria bacterium]|nr:CRISPR-associated endonuclease Cas3'' [Deltaproteobacteria bacterium]
MRSWAKAHRDEAGEIRSFHSLIGHCLDVAAVFEALLSVAPARKALARFGGWDDFDGAAIARLAVLAGLHDVGKVNLSFQARLLGEKRRGGHVEPVLSLFHDSTAANLRDCFVESIRAREIFTWFGDDPEALTSALYATFCHHGRPGVPQRPAHRNEWTTKGRRGPFEEMRDVAEALWTCYSQATL